MEAGHFFKNTIGFVKREAAFQNEPYIYQASQNDL